MSKLTPSQRAQLGNRNACVPKAALKTSHLHIRCRRADKSCWVKAAKAQRESGLLDRYMSRNSVESALAAWATLRLNEAADAQLGPEAALRRKRGFTPGGDGVG